jgi:hypothetical protein
LRGRREQGQGKSKMDLQKYGGRNNSKIQAEDKKNEGHKRVEKNEVSIKKRKMK